MTLSAADGLSGEALTAAIPGWTFALPPGNSSAPAAGAGCETQAPTSAKVGSVVRTEGCLARGARYSAGPSAAPELEVRIGPEKIGEEA
jgi:hypothetical protein